MGNHFESSLGKTTSGLVMRKRANKRIRSLERSTVWRTSLGLTSFRRSDVISDASPVGLGAIPQQDKGTGERIPIVYISRSLTLTERRLTLTQQISYRLYHPSKIIFPILVSFVKTTQDLLSHQICMSDLQAIVLVFPMLKFMPAQSIRASLYQGTLRCRSDFTCRFPPCDTNMYTLYTIPIGF